MPLAERRMNFLDEVREYLRAVRSRQDSPSSTSSTPAIEPAWVSARMIDLLERVAQDPASHHSQWERQHSKWLASGWAVAFAQRMAGALAKGFLADAGGDAIREAVSVAMARQLHLPDSLPSPVRTRELDRIARTVFDQVATGTSERRVDPWSVVADYALEIRATRTGPEGLRTTPIATVLLDLSGRDAIAWLLHVEIAQSTGPYDPWRLGRETALAILREPERVAPPEKEYWESFPASWSSLRRLEALGILDMVSDHEADLEGYELRELGRTILADVASPRESPLSVLAHSLVQDEVLSTVGDHLEASGAGLERGVAAAATARQARMFAHEIRNALTPVDVAIRALLDQLGLADRTVVDRFRPRIDDGIRRIFRFVDQLLQIAELPGRPPEAFAILPAVRDAIVEAGTAVPVHHEWPSVSPGPQWSGFRERFVLAVANLLRNAGQNGASQIWVALEVEPDRSEARLSVEDDGPGIDPALRQEVFSNGVSYRGGGSGHGLALVREIVEKELGGRIVCTDSDRGGARFVVTAPLHEGN